MTHRIVEDSPAIKCILIAAALIADNNRRMNAVLSAGQWAGLVRFVSEVTNGGKTCGFESTEAVVTLYLIASGQQTYALPINSESPPKLREVKT